MAVSAPQNVRHEGHVGLSPDGQMEVAFTAEMENTGAAKKMFGALGGQAEPDYHAHARGRAGSEIHLSFSHQSVAPPKHDTNRRSDGAFGDWEEFDTEDGASPRAARTGKAHARPPPARSPPPHAHPASPPGAGTGRKYYYNNATGETSWELPITARVVQPPAGAYTDSYHDYGANYHSQAPQHGYGAYDAYATASV